MSDEDVTESSEGDFSASEDEWLPVKKKGKNKYSSASEEADSFSSDDDFEESPEKSAQNKRKSNGNVGVKASKARKLSADTRELLYNKYKSKEPSEQKPVNPTLGDILNNSQYKKKKTIPKKTDHDSESSGDDYLVDPNKLNLNSEFFDTVAQKVEKPIQFDCNAGMKLSDSSDSEEVEANSNMKTLISQINEQSQNCMNLKKLEEFSRKLEEAKLHLKNYKSKNTESDQGTQISDLLAMGEPKLTNENEKSKDSNSESDWDEVEDDEGVNDKKPQKDVEVIVELGSNRKQRNFELEIELCIKRQINRVKRLHQLNLHKVSVLCAIAQGNHMNSILNEPKVLAVGLSLLQAKECYPKKGTDLKYFQTITKWFISFIKLGNDEMCDETGNDLGFSLMLELFTKKAKGKRDYVLLFIILLRSMGIECRMVMSASVPPKRPGMNDLCPMSERKEKVKVEVSKELTPKQEIKEEIVKEVVSEVKVSPVPKENIKIEKSTKNPRKVTTRTSRKALISLNIPQLDGNDDTAVTNPGRVTRSRQAKLTKTETPKKAKKNESPRTPFSKMKINGTPKQEIPPPEKVEKKRKLFTANKEEYVAEVPKPQENVKEKKEIKSKKIQKIEADLEDDESDSDFETPKKKSNRKKVTPAKSVSNKKVNKQTSCGSTNNAANKKKGMNIWVEVYSEKDSKWLTIDIFAGKVDCVESICRLASHPISYVFAWNNDNSIKDVSARYCAQWNNVKRKLRVESEWLDKALNQFLGEKSSKDLLEDKELDKLHIDKPLPTTISEYKNHPLYALQRHLLKFEALYPPDVPSLGFIRKEPVFARECVFTLLTREKWFKQAKVVKAFEKPYKIVKCIKYDKFSNTFLRNQPLDIFGIWQTEDYDPPTAENGLVPRNAYGNVELFQPSMLPKKTVHLQLPGLNKVCKKLNIDCAAAVIGFEAHKMRCHPIYDGFVVCEEFSEQLVEAWYKEQEEEEKKEQEKLEKRVYGNWKKIIKGLFIRKKLQNKYNFDNL